ncbi:MAG: hypothetical protein H6985_18455 [Pseudomonadales bacterium]|nr:hypothetical protein [Pseudomonadales bacterium]
MPVPEPISKLSTSIVRSVSQAYVMARYLQELFECVGVDYQNSPIRLEHGTGTGFFGVSNTGSTDCIKERFRGITDGLGLKYRTIDNIYFRSRSCMALKHRDKAIHRIEHTYELIDMYNDFEELYIMSRRPFSANDLATHVIESQIVCLIEKKEQKTGTDLRTSHNKQEPFSKYSSTVFLGESDVSAISKSEILEINRTRFAELLERVSTYDFSEDVDAAKQKLIVGGPKEASRKHTLPLLSFAKQYARDEFSLLRHHYTHKLEKRMDRGSRWYGEADSQRYLRWLNESNGG